MIFKHKKKIGCETPEYSRPILSPPPVQIACPYETPCGWCTKWDKKCNQKMHDRFGEVVDALVCDIWGHQVQQIKITTELHRYMRYAYEMTGVHLTSGKQIEFMGIPVVIDDNLNGEFYEIVLKENGYDT